jgi:hypothetical protein
LTANLPSRSLIQSYAPGSVSGIGTVYLTLAVCTLIKFWKLRHFSVAATLFQKVIDLIAVPFPSLASFSPRFAQFHLAAV